MSHLDYYRFQATARGVFSLKDIIARAEQRAYIYDRIVLPWLSKKSPRVVELACGHGSFLWWLKARGFERAIGVDSSREQIVFARQVRLPVFEGDVNDWLSKQVANSLDVMVGIDLIEHLSKDAFMQLLKSSARVLGTEGKLILRYPNGDSPLVGRNLFNDITHVWTYTTNCIETLARMHGFQRFEFRDESADAIRDQRWIKVPLCKIATAILRVLFRSATKEAIPFWSPHIWACLQK